MKSYKRPYCGIDPFFEKEHKFMLFFLWKSVMHILKQTVFRHALVTRPCFTIKKINEIISV